MTKCSTDIELLPCPFCGSQPVTDRTEFSLRAMYIYCINDNGCPRPKAIGETEEKAIENWNLRAQPATPTAGGDEAARTSEPVAWRYKDFATDRWAFSSDKPHDAWRLKEPLYLDVAQPSLKTAQGE